MASRFEFLRIADRATTTPEHFIKARLCYDRERHHYTLDVDAVRIHDGFESMTLHMDGVGRYLVEENVPRFNHKRMDELANLVRSNGHVDAAVAKVAAARGLSLAEAAAPAA